MRVNFTIRDDGSFWLGMTLAFLTAAICTMLFDMIISIPLFMGGMVTMLKSSVDLTRKHVLRITMGEHR